MIYTGFMNDFNTLDDKHVVEHVFHLRLISFIYCGTCVVGALLCLIPIKPSKASLLSQAVMRLIVLAPLCMAFYDGFNLIKDDGSKMYTEIKNFACYVFCMIATVLGLTHGFIFMNSIFRICKRADEKVSVNMLLLVISTGSFIGAWIQIGLLVLTRSMF